MSNRGVEIGNAEDALSTVEMQLDIECRVAASMEAHEVADLVVAALESEDSLTVEYVCTSMQDHLD